MFLKKRNDAQFLEALKKVKRTRNHIPKSAQGLVAVLLGLMLAVLCSFVIKALQPPVSSLQPDYWQKFLSEETNYKTALLQIEGSSEVYYVLEEVNEEFVSLLAVEQWSRQLRKPSGKEMLIFCSGGSPHWVFYSDGSVGAYAPHWVRGKKQLYYKIPNDVVDRLIDYISSNGIVREYGYFTDDTTYFDYDVQSQQLIF
ncbi:MAG: hypothetical protein IKK41_01345 [Oscillospiraceae bacterium]|nr:hypothetical protein [Oscillospiraceae bacterium]